MAEVGLFEAERSAWIKARRWGPGKTAALRRSDRLARKARRQDRTAKGLDDLLLHEAETKSTLHRWTHLGEDSGSRMVGALLYAVIYGSAVVLLGLAWCVGTLSYKGWESVASVNRPRVAPYAIVAAACGAFFWIARVMGLDLLPIYLLAEGIEIASGGLIAPAVLSRWYAAGIVSWLEIQVVLGLLYGGWLVYAWGWMAPAVRRGHRVAAEAWDGKTAAAPAESTRTDEDAPQKPVKPKKLSKEEQITKIISGGDSAA